MGQGFESLKTHHMVAVVQLVERQIVVLVVVGSSPTGHPIIFNGISPSGKAPHFDCGIRRFKSCYPSQHGSLAQSVEHMTFNHGVRGSIPR